MNNNVTTILSIIDSYFPDAKCELNHSNAFELVVSVMLSAQCTDKAVNKLTDSLFKKYPNYLDYIDVPLTQLEQDIRSIGLYKNKAKHLKNIAIMIDEEFKGIVPDNQKELEKLPGVGRKTANVVLSEWFGVPRIAVDTHVSRISKRLNFANQDDDVLTIENKLMSLIPEDKWTKTHHQFIFFGRYHCKAKNPLCEDCKLKQYCNMHK